MEVTSPQITFDQAFKVLDDLVYTQRQKPLSEAETVVVEGVWNAISYEEISRRSKKYTKNYLQRIVAPELWHFLSAVLGQGEQVKKTNLRYFLEREVILANPSLSVSSQPALNQQQVSGQMMGDRPPDVTHFYGRESELANLQQLTAQNQCVSLTGALGIGKSALAAKLLAVVATKPDLGFNHCLWKSVAPGLSFEELLTQLIDLFGLQLEPDMPLYPQAKVSALLKFLQSQRCLLVLDITEVVSQGLKTDPRWNTLESEEFRLFLRRVIEERHQSCLVITSREPLSSLVLLERSKRPIRIMKLKGLEMADAVQLLQAKGLTSQEWSHIVQTYRGNPLLLEDVASRIQRFFGGNVDQFLGLQTTMENLVYQAMLDQQFGESGQLGMLEQQMMVYLAQGLTQCPEPLILSKVLSDLKSVNPASTSSDLLRALEVLEARCLIETSFDKETGEAKFSLQPVIKKYLIKDLSGVECESYPIQRSA